MKWIPAANLWLLVFLTLGSASRADLVVLHHSYAFRHNEQTGEKLTESHPSFVETTDAGTFGPDGNYYVAGNSLGAGSIVRFDGQTGLYLDSFVRDQDTSLTIPMGIAFGPDGDLYVTSRSQFEAGGGIYRFDGKTGVEKPKFVPQGEGGVTNASALAFGPDGSLYVIENNVAVVRFQPESGAPMGLFAFGAATDIVFGPDGSLYRLYNDVIRFDPESAAVIGTVVEAGAGELDRPVKLAFGPDGDIYIGEFSTLKIKRFDGKTGIYKGVFTQSQPMTYYDRLTSLNFSQNRLAISPSATGMQVKWPNTFGYFKLERRNSLDSSGSWTTVNEEPTLTGFDLTHSFYPNVGQTYFRLIKQ